MATNWTDATLYTEVEAEASFPELFDGLTETADTYFHSDVKARIGKMIRYRYHDLKDFDIEEITSASITELKEGALFYNNYYVARKQIVNGSDSDAFKMLADHYLEEAKRYLKVDIELIEFDEPDGINDLKAFSYEIKR